MRKPALEAAFERCIWLCSVFCRVVRAPGLQRMEIAGGVTPAKAGLQLSSPGDEGVPTPTPSCARTEHTRSRALSAPQSAAACLPCRARHRQARQAGPPRGAYRCPPTTFRCSDVPGALRGVDVAPRPARGPAGSGPPTPRRDGSDGGGAGRNSVQQLKCRHCLLRFRAGPRSSARNRDGAARPLQSAEEADWERVGCDWRARVLLAAKQTAGRWKAHQTLESSHLDEATARRGCPAIMVCKP